MMNEREQHVQESLFGDEMMNGKQHQREEEQSQEVPREPSPVENDVQPEPDLNDPQERAGTILKRERESQGISLEIVHEATKIPMDALRAIEEGYTVRTLSPFYYKGFVKMYAGYLGMDVSKVIDDYKEEELPEHIKQDVDIGEFQMPRWITNSFTRRRKRQMVIIAGILLALFLFVKMVGFVGKLFSRPPVKKSVEQAQVVKKGTVKLQTAKTETQKKVVEEKKEEPPPPVKTVTPKIIRETQPKVQPIVKRQPAPEPAPKPAAVAPTPTSVSTSLLSKAITLTVRAKQNSWLRVKADGNVVFQSTLRLGAVETWAADDEIEISGKNINQLEFELNGKMIGTLGRKDRNAKKVIITKNGLSVKN